MLGFSATFENGVFKEFWKTRGKAYYTRSCVLGKILKFDDKDRSTFLTEGQDKSKRTDHQASQQTLIQASQLNG